MIMKALPIKLLLIYLSFWLSIKSVAQQDSILQSHIRIVTPKYHFQLPATDDDLFCEKLNSIKIPKTLDFDHSIDTNAHYFLSINFSFDKNGKFVNDVKKLDNNGPLKQIEGQLILLLSSTKWRVDDDAKGHEIELRCNIFRKGITKVVIASYDNADAKEICP